jgi:hypothetical protein
MPDELDRNFMNQDDAKAEIRAAVEYLLRGAPAATSFARSLRLGHEVANGEQQNPLDDGMPGD